MAVERRVKQSHRVKEALREKRKTVLKIVSLVLCMLLCGALGFWLAQSDLVRSIKYKDDIAAPIEDVSALRAEKQQTAKYDGTWVTGPNGMYNLLFIAEPDTDKTTASDISKVFRRDDYDKSMYAMYGVMNDSSRYHSDVTVDSEVFMQDLATRALVDVMLGTNGSNPSVTWNFEATKLSNGRSALKVDADFQLTVSYKNNPNEDEPDEFDEEQKYGLHGYLLQSYGYPVFVFGVYRVFNFSSEHDVPMYVDSMIDTFFDTKWDDFGNDYVDDEPGVGSIEEIPVIEPAVPYKNPAGTDISGPAMIPADRKDYTYYYDDSGEKVYLEPGQEAPEGVETFTGKKTVDVDMSKAYIESPSNIVRDSETNEPLGVMETGTGDILYITDEYLQYLKEQEGDQE